MKCLKIASRSSVVERVLINAWSRGKRFSVKVVDSRPLSEGIGTS
jgi:translation initiation factor 2B subunit (eIF-2B alpha/beta/delta family)